MIKFNTTLICSGGIRDQVKCQETIRSISHPTAAEAATEITREAALRGWQFLSPYTHLCPQCAAAHRAAHQGRNKR